MCQTCGEGFSQIVQLERHFRRNHENVEIRCDDCPLTFATNENLRRHISSVHEGRKKYKCDSCDKIFSLSPRSGVDRE